MTIPTHVTPWEHDQRRQRLVVVEEWCQRLAAAITALQVQVDAIHATIAPQPTQPPNPIQTGTETAHANVDPQTWPACDIADMIAEQRRAADTT